MGELTSTDWLALLMASLLVGLAKTAVSGFASLAVVLFAAVLPARESTGALLPLLLFGDVIAVAWYRRQADWGTLWRLLPGVIPGLLLGAWFLSFADDVATRRTIAVILIVMSSYQLLQLMPRHGAAASGVRPQSTHPSRTLGVGAAAGFATMTANAAGPITTVYLIRAGLPMVQLIGTGAWFYLAVNLAKVPFGVGLGLITPESLLRDLILVPALIVGAALGVALVGRLKRRQFELLALGLAVVASVLLLL